MDKPVPSVAKTGNRRDDTTLSCRRAVPRRSLLYFVLALWDADLTLLLYLNGLVLSSRIPCLLGLNDVLWDLRHLIPQKFMRSVMVTFGAFPKRHNY
ncbi:hypothetical protein Zmor_001826 [Zophobas morio]|uniref:Uncharacterized protein n=1 Tax=Zophobas morio TaxID=2755281 RepID=A0AA38MT02_9CUCU|nr:hypothetical protein Zmor_001826 [Zophobas morio]